MAGIVVNGWIRTLKAFEQDTTVERVYESIVYIVANLLKVLVCQVYS